MAAKKSEPYSMGTLMQDFAPLKQGNYLAGGWTVARARAARDAHMCGSFRESAQLHEATKTDPQNFGAMLNRIAPHRGLPRKVEGNGKRIVKEATAALDAAAKPAVDADAFEWMVSLGVSVETIAWTKNDEGDRLLPRLIPWPMRSVYVDRATGELKTHTTKGVKTITHGDGKWLVTKLQNAEPWQSGVVKSIADHWAKRAAHLRDRSLNSETHGEGKVIGTLPQGMRAKSAAAKGFAQLVQDLRKRRSGGVIPHGATIEYLEAMSQMWRIFQDAITSIDKDIARAWLGQDGSMVNEGGNYVKTALLFGVRNDLVEGDLGARAMALNTGLLLPFSWVNYGRDAGLTCAWEFPDADRDARTAAYGARVDAFNKAVKEYKANGFQITQQWVDDLAKRYDVDAPKLDPSPPKPVVAPTTRDDELDDEDDADAAA